MPATVTFQWEPDPEIYARQVREVEYALEDFSRPLMAAEAVMQTDIKQAFITETAPDGTPWQEWSKLYEPQALSYPNVGILWQSGELYDAATSTEATMISENSVFYNTQMLPHYGLAHQFGLADRDAAGDLPARPFLGMSDESAVFIFAAFSEWFDRSIDLFITPRGRLGRRHALRGPTGFISRASVGKMPLEKF